MAVRNDGWRDHRGYKGYLTKVIVSFWQKR